LEVELFILRISRFKKLKNQNSKKEKEKEKETLKFSLFTPRFRDKLFKFLLNHS